MITTPGTSQPTHEDWVVEVRSPSSHESEEDTVGARGAQCGPRPRTLAVH